MRELVLTEEQSMLQRAARDFVAGRSSYKRVRQAMSAEPAFSRALWAEMAKLGWVGTTIPEADGGSGLGHGHLMVILEEMGRGLMPEPFVPTVLLGAGAIAIGGSDAQKRAHLPAVARGERLLALAHDEAASRWSLTALETTAAPDGDGFVLQGEKTQVMGGASADWLVVSAQCGGGIGLFLVAASAPGVTVQRQRRIDGRDAAIVRLEGVRAAGDGVLSAADGALWILERTIDAATIGLCAEMLGSMTAAFAMTVDYLRTRVQFGVPIGSFQALQHRAARLYAEIELARSAVLYAHAVLDDPAATARDVARAASVAKAKCSDAAMHVAHEAIQMHGGIGMTDEHDVGLFVKRARVAEMTFGDSGHHRERFARLGGY
jgi:acyl-CoA dehydrogenase